MISHYLMFNRNCSEALETYVKAFGAEIIEMKKYADVPNLGFPMDDNDKNLILHSNLHGSLQDKFGINWMFTATK